MIRVTSYPHFDARFPPDDELALTADDTLLVLEEMDDGWCKGRMPDGTEGMFPGNYVADI